MWVTTGRKLEAAFQQIEDELRTQYVATYTSSNTKLDGTFRKLSVECRGDGLKVQTRKGYFAPAHRPRNGDLTKNLSISGCFERARL